MTETDINNYFLLLIENPDDMDLNDFKNLLKNLFEGAALYDNKCAKNALNSIMNDEKKELYQNVGIYDYYQNIIFNSMPYKDTELNKMLNKINVDQTYINTIARSLNDTRLLLIDEINNKKR